MVAISSCSVLPWAPQTHPPRTGDWRFPLAVALSALIHGLGVGWLPGISRNAAAPAPPLRVTFDAQPIKETKPAPVLPAQITFPRPANRLPALSRPVHAASPQVLAAEHSDIFSPAASPPAAATDKSATSPAVGLPAAKDAPKPPPDSAVLSAYGQRLAQDIALHQRYPRIAQLRQWQGTALLQLQLTADGDLTDVRVLSSSGHEVLDRQAIDMVRETTPLPPVPRSVAGRPLTIDVPVVFRFAG